MSSLSPFSLALEKSLTSCFLPFSSEEYGLGVKGWMPDLGKRHKKYYGIDSNNSSHKLLRAVFTSDMSVSL